MTANDWAIRPAHATDASAMAAAQRAAWAQHDCLPELPSPEEVAAAWRAAVDQAPSPAHRILIASSGPSLVGFAAYGPGSAPETGELFELVIDP
ncbi:MAG: hypothetical protein ACRC0L_13125, partial [Angustibacter sp.]